MAGRIQTQPRGLLNFLGLKTSGRNADVWPDHVQPTVEATRFYEGAMTTRYASRSLFDAAPDELDAYLAVPATEQWHVLHFAIGFTLEAQATALFSTWVPRFVNAPTAYSSVNEEIGILGPLVTATGGATFDQTHYLHTSFREGFYMPPNTGIGYRVVDFRNFAGTLDVNVYAIIRVLPTPV